MRGLMSYSELYYELGETEGLEKLAKRMYQYNLLDSRISQYFEIGMISHFEKMFATFLSGLVGGKEYDRKAMIYSHRRVNIQDHQFNAFVENMTVAMRHELIPQAVIDKLLVLIESTRDDICGRTDLKCEQRCPHFSRSAQPSEKFPTKNSKPLKETTSPCAN
ncbi:hypothetical protein L0F63_007133, partial [Massospora cicadina]